MVELEERMNLCWMDCWKIRIDNSMETASWITSQIDDGMIRNVVGMQSNPSKMGFPLLLSQRMLMTHLGDSDLPSPNMMSNFLYALLGGVCL